MTARPGVFGQKTVVAYGKIARSAHTPEVHTRQRRDDEHL